MITCDWWYRFSTFLCHWLRRCILGLLLLPWFILNLSVDNLHSLLSVGWICLFIPKRQRCNSRCLQMDTWSHPTFDNGCNQLSKLRFKLYHVSERGPRYHCWKWARRCRNISPHVYWSIILGFWLFNTLRPRQDGRHFPDDIFKCIFWMKMYEFPLKFHWSLFPKVRLTIFQHWFR